MTKIRPEDLEKYSSAVTLSDMEVFVFPELFYALILANIMSPLVWKWREEDCFKKLKGKDSFTVPVRARRADYQSFYFTHLITTAAAFATILSNLRLFR